MSAAIVGLTECEVNTGSLSGPTGRFPRLYAPLCAQPAGTVCDSRPDHPQTPSAQREGGGAMVPATSARPGRGPGRTTQCQTPGPLPVLRASDELPLSVAVLSAGPAALAQVAQPADTREDAALARL